jgi:hypothetical protein
MSDSISIEWKRKMEPTNERRVSSMIKFGKLLPVAVLSTVIAVVGAVIPTPNFLFNPNNVAHAAASNVAVIDTKRLDDSAKSIPYYVFTSDILVGVFREYKDPKMSFKVDLPFMSAEGKFFVVIKDPSGKVIASGYTIQVGGNAEFSISVDVSTLTGGEYIVEIKDEKFKTQTSLVTEKIILPDTLPDIYWEEHHKQAV